MNDDNVDYCNAVEMLFYSQSLMTCVIVNK